MSWPAPPYRSFFICSMALVIMLLRAPAARCQDSSFQSAVRFYLDNDCINLRLQFSDEAYTNGLQLGYYRVIPDRPGFLLSHILPRAGKNATNTYGWSVMQVMYSPTDLKVPVPDSSDYPYSAGLFATHSLHSSDAVKKFSIQSGLTLGMMGPPALGEQTQKLVHRIMKFVQPAGWEYQQQTALLANIDLTVEKMLKESGRSFELIGGANANAGTMYNALSAYLLIRAGQLNPYFNGLLSQSNAKKGTGKLLISVIASPGAQVVFYNSLVDGGLLRRWSGREVSKAQRPLLTTTQLNLAFSYGFALAWNSIGISVLQRRLMPASGHLRDHEVGNLSITVAF